MRSFGGEFARSQKVSLAGKSRQAESREDVLQRTRQERERRRQQKLEAQAATRIQAAWRAYLSVQTAKNDTRTRWQARYGGSGENASTSEVSESSSSYLRDLCFFVDPRSATDVNILAKACHLAVTTSSPPLPGIPALCIAAGHSQSTGSAMLTIVRAQRLVKLALDALALHSHALQDQLYRSRHLDTARCCSESDTSIAGCLVEAITTFVAPEAWEQSLRSSDAAHAAVAHIIASLVLPRDGLFEKLACIAACPVVDQDNSSGGRRRAAPIAEVLTTQLVVRYLSVHAQMHQKLDIVATNSCSQPASLMCVPLISQRMPSLTPVLPHLWVGAVKSLHRFSALELGKWLLENVKRVGVSPTTTATGAVAVTAAALLGNLLENTAEALDAIANVQRTGERVPSSNNDDITERMTVGFAFVDIALRLLCLVPQHLFSQGSQGAAGTTTRVLLIDDEDAENYEKQEALILGALKRSQDMDGVHFSANHTGAADGDAQRRGGATTRLPISTTTAESFHGHCDVLRGVKAQLASIADSTVLTAVLNATLPYKSAPTMEPRDATLNLGALRGDNDANGGGKVCEYVLRVLTLQGQRQRALLALALRSRFIARLWYSYLRPLHETKGWVESKTSTCDPGWMLPLCLFSEAFSMAIVLSGDRALYDRQQPLPLEELPNVLSLLRHALWHVLWAETAPIGGWPPAAAALRARFSSSAGRLMAQLHDRNGRRPFAPPHAFYADNLPPERFHAEVASGVAAGLDVETPEGSRAWGLLAHAPFLVPFVERARVFQRLVATERARHRSGSSERSWSMMFGEGGGGGGGNRFVTVRRGRALSDAFGALNKLSPEEFRGRVRVAFVSELGTAEAGVDGGGIFKEFLEEAVKEGFDPGNGLFLTTTDHRLYPNPHAMVTNPSALALLEFLGRLLGKALWEGILVELPLAWFFLKKFLGAAADVDDLPTLDPQLGRSLLSLRDLTPDEIEALGLTFSLTDFVLGQTREVEVIPGGRDIPVTATNAAAFIHAVADFRLNKQLRAPTAAFLRGVHALIPREWIAMFNPRELQELISGAEGDAALNLADMRAHVQYAGGYSADHPVIKAFWEALASFTPSQQSGFLRFVTSCPRPPLLGFACLEPPLCIQEAGSEGDGSERLPTAATCMNLLKLPPYAGGVAQLRSKLLYAIEAGAGFELS